MSDVRQRLCCNAFGHQLHTLVLTVLTLHDCDIDGLMNPLNGVMMWLAVLLVVSHSILDMNFNC